MNGKQLLLKATSDVKDNDDVIVIIRKEDDDGYTEILGHSDMDIFEMIGTLEMVKSQLILGELEE